MILVTVDCWTLFEKDRPCVLLRATGQYFTLLTLRSSDVTYIQQSETAMGSVTTPVVLHSPQYVFCALLRSWIQPTTADSRERKQV